MKEIATRPCNTSTVESSVHLAQYICYFQEILGGKECVKPVLQVLGIKRIPGNEGTVRYRLLVSDGKNLISYAMLATQLNHFADENKLTDNTIICIEKYILSVVSQEK